MTLLEVLLASSVHHHQKVVDDLLQVKRLIFSRAQTKIRNLEDSMPLFCDDFSSLKRVCMY
jgi:hypothetical protein